MASDCWEDSADSTQSSGRLVAFALLALFTIYLIVTSPFLGNQAFILSSGGLLNNTFIKNPKLFKYLFTREPLAYVGYQFLPVSFVFLALLRRMFGQNVAAWHLWLSFLQFVNACLVFYVVRMFSSSAGHTSGSRGAKGSAIRQLAVPAAAAMLFLFLPAGLIFANNPDLMKYPLSMAFGLVSLVVFGRAMERRKPAVWLGLFMLSLLLMTLGILSSRFAIMVIVLACLLPGRGRWLKVGYVLVGLLVLVLEVWTVPYPLFYPGRGFRRSLLNFLMVRGTLIGPVWSANLLKLLGGTPSSFFSNCSPRRITDFGLWLHNLVHLSVLMGGLVLFLGARRNPLLGSGLILVYLSPLMSLLNCRYEYLLFSDKFLYYAALGVALLLAGAIQVALRALERRRRQGRAGVSVLAARAALALVAVGYLLFGVIGFYSRQGDFCNDVTFWEAAANSARTAPAGALLRLGQAHFQAGNLDEARRQFQRAAYDHRDRATRVEAFLRWSLLELYDYHSSLALKLALKAELLFKVLRKPMSLSTGNLQNFGVLSVSQVKLANPGLLDDAEGYLGRVVTTRRWSVPSRIYIADIFYLRGFPYAAVDTLEETRQIDPSAPEVLARLTFILRELQDPIYRDYQKKWARAQTSSLRLSKLSGLTQVRNYYEYLSALHHDELVRKYGCPQKKRHRPTMDATTGATPRKPTSLPSGNQHLSE